MKERPILFSGEMVRAILDGRKTQTRRVIKPQPVNADYWTVNTQPSEAFYPNTLAAEPKLLICPYGATGSSMWVRETWNVETRDDGYALRYHADNELLWIHESEELYLLKYLTDAGLIDERKRPSIYMPRWASRITLEVTGIRVEHVQDISGYDVLSEGVNSHVHQDADYFERAQRKAFRSLWNSINGKRGYWFDTNPWVWVIEFVLAGAAR